MQFYVKFKVLIIITVKNIIFWDVLWHSLVEVYRIFGSKHCLHLQD
jgi:hypothetical protein